MQTAIQAAKKGIDLKAIAGYLILALVVVRLGIESGKHPALAYGFAAFSGLMFAYNLIMIYGRKSTVMVIPSLFGSLAAIGLVESLPMKVIVMAALATCDFGLLPAWGRSRQSEK